MKILYAIQGTGNGHLARAIELVPLIKEMADTDILVSGIQGDIQLPFEVKYSFYGSSFIFGKKGGIDLFQTLLKFRPVQFLIDIFRLPIHNYDLIISDYEPLTAWSCLLRGRTCIGLSHQNAVLHPKAPTPNSLSQFSKAILKYYAPTTSKYGFHFTQIDEFNFTPVIRSEIRKAKYTNKGHYTVYLPAFSDEELAQILQYFPEVNWQIFSKHCKKSYQKGKLNFNPVSQTEFLESFIACEGILCGAGFETPAEALFMGKKLCVVPMKHQHEQACNAEYLKSMGVMVLSSLKSEKEQLHAWLKSDLTLQLKYPDETRTIISNIIAKHHSELALRLNFSTVLLNFKDKYLMRQ